ncbi:MAG: hypothetical protein HYV75_11605 [Opitutae bacterium]|nr:hypothetical protein [Opitutae bacterium]
MKYRLPPSLLAAAAFISPSLAQAHPGHDGDHELVWDVEHFLSHPLASIACAALVVAAGWAVWRLLKPSPATRQQDRSARRDR